MKFGVIADCQYADVDIVDIVPERKFRKSKIKLKEAVDFFNSQDIEFVVHLGDFIDHNVNGIDKLNAITRNLNKPLFHILGNHDFYEEWPNETNRNSKVELLKHLDMPSAYYEKIFGNYRFLFLNSNEVGVIESEFGSDAYMKGVQLLNEQKQEGHINAEVWNGTISIEQLKWLVEKIEAAEYAKQKVILLAHHPVFPEHRENMLEFDKMLNLFNKHNNIIAYLSGHNHDGNQGIIYDVPCITFKGMVDTDENSYSIVELTNSLLTIQGFGREKSRKLKTRE